MMLPFTSSGFWQGGSARLDSAAIWEQILAARLTGAVAAAEQSGLGEDERTLLAALMPLALHRGRLAIGQLGQSLDGRIATASGDSWYINGPAARAHLHRLRALVDAVLVGAGTAEEDRPQLNVRLVSGADPVPVILDPRGRVPMQGPLFERAPGAVPVLHLVGAELDLASAPEGVERVGIELGPAGACPRQVLDLLAERGLQRVLIEGGGVTVSRFLAADALDYLHLLIAPLIIGSGRPGLQLEPIQRLAEARRPPMRSFALDDELLVELALGSAAR